MTTNTLPAIAKPLSLLMDPTSFEHLQRVGKMLALSPLFPEHLRKGSQESAIANGVLVMNMAARLGEDPLSVAQNIYFVSGKPGWSSSYMISKANQHGVFKNPIDWDIKGSGDTLSVTAFAELAATGRTVKVTCDMKMAKAEGWTSNKKYQTMPEQMLRYRSAAFLIRLYCPEVMVGVPAQVEVEFETMRDVTPVETPKDPENGAVARAAKAEAKPKTEEVITVEADADEPDPAETETPHDPETGEVIEEKAEPETTPAAEEKQAAPAMTEKDAEALYNRLVDELMADIPANELQERYAPQIATVKAQHPAFHTMIIREFEAQ